MKKKTADQAAGIILAAGASTRMGRPKQLLQTGDVCLLDRILKETDNSDLDHIVAVLGYRAMEIRDSLKIDIDNPRLKIVENKKWKNGVSSSIIEGLSAVEGEYDHCMIILADMPYVTSDLINRLLNEYLGSGMDLGAIKTGNRRSHPVIFHRSLYPELFRLKGDIGARQVFKRYPDRICFVNSNDYNDMDLDTPDDYNFYITMTKNNSTGT